MSRKVRALESLADVDENKVYTVSEVAQLLRRSQDTIRKDIVQGSIPALRLDREYRISGRVLRQLFGEDQQTYTQAEVDRAVAKAVASTRAMIFGELYKVVSEARVSPLTGLRE